MYQLLSPADGEPYAIVSSVGGQKLTDIPEASIVEAYKRFGALLLRGFHVDTAIFSAFTGQYCSGSVFNESPDRELVDAERNIQTVNGGVAAFPLHPELSREPWKPDVCFFYCQTAPQAGGETTVCDGIEVVRQLPPNVRGAFEGKRLRYLQVASPELCQFWLGSSDPSDALLSNSPFGCPYEFARNQDGRVVRSFTRPALHKPMFANEPAWGNFLFFARYMNRRVGFPSFGSGEPVPDELLSQVHLVADRLTSAIRWQPGDVLMLDNTRFMHGRRAILDSQERRILTYFGYLRFAEPDADETPGAPWRLKSFRPPNMARGQRLV